MGIDIDISKKLGDFRLQVAFRTDHKRIALLGASGCGKSMTLKSIAGIVRPDEGYISLDDRQLYDSKKHIDIRPQDRGVGYLFQSYALFPNMTVRENIEAVIRKGRTDKKKKADEVIAMLGLESMASLYPSALSGGQQQRCALARILAYDPGLILLDEPFSALDAHLREGLRLELIRLLESYDRTVILVTHDRDEAYQLCDYIVLMQEGRVIEAGSRDEIFMHPHTVAGARMTGCKNISRIEWTEDHRVRALDFGNELLSVPFLKSEEITHIGIRAHDFRTGRGSLNNLSLEGARLSEMPFEWYVTLKNGMWWKEEKSLYESRESISGIEYINIPPEHIMPLKERYVSSCTYQQCPV